MFSKASIQHQQDGKVTRRHGISFSRKSRYAMNNLVSFYSNNLTIVLDKVVSKMLSAEDSTFMFQEKNSTSHLQKLENGPYILLLFRWFFMVLMCPKKSPHYNREMLHMDENIPVLDFPPSLFMAIARAVCASNEIEP